MEGMQQNLDALASGKLTNFLGIVDALPLADFGLSLYFTQNNVARLISAISLIELYTFLLHWLLFLHPVSSQSL